MKLSVIDFETANASPASACSIGIIVIEDGVVLHEAVHLIKPHPSVRYFAPENIAIHGIEPEMVEHEPEFDAIWPLLYPWLDKGVVAAHHAPFDLGVLNALLTLYGLSKPLCTVIDTVEVARKVYPHLPNHRLNTVCAYLEIPLNHHEALSDARGSALILLNAMAHLNDYDLGSLIRHLRLKEIVL